jgi:tetratricopeptide (TPR) repeat protein
MRSCAAASVICICCLGSDPAGAVSGPSVAASPTAPIGNPVSTPPVSPALALWEQGQRAILAGDVDGAMEAYQASLRLDPGLTRNYLSLAAACLEKGADAAAADHMANYLRHQPDHFVVRLHYADLLLRLGRPLQAREQFERFIADVQTRPALAEEHLIHCHSRLMEIAESQQDEYGEHLNRGIGLYLLAKQREAFPESAGRDISAEGMLCKAAGELTLATRGRPDEARPCWYLSAVWTELAQRRPAARWLRAASAAAPFSYLTPCERGALRLACRQCETETRQR